MYIPKELKRIYEEGFFQDPLPLSVVKERLSKDGTNCSTDTLRKALDRASGLRGFLFASTVGGVRLYQQRRSPTGIVAVAPVGTDLFEDALIHSLGTAFEQEIKDLRLNYDKSGTCTAFLLRKILEKLIFIAFSKHGLDHKLKDSNGYFMGLEAMINLAAQEKANGTTFLTPHTAKEVKGIKFLGDVSAHNPLINVDMKEVVLQLPYITVAYKELATKL